MNDRDVLNVIESSRAFQLVNDGAARVARAAETSVFVALARDLTHWWSAQPSRRRRALGVTLLVAGAVHIAIQATQSQTGWLWLIVPVWAMAAGAMLVGASRADSNEISS